MSEQHYRPYEEAGYGNREDYISRTEEEIQQYQNQIEAYRSEMDDTDRDANLKYENMIPGLEARLNELRLHLEEAKAASRERWEDVEEHMRRMSGDMKEAIETARNEIGSPAIRAERDTGWQEQ